MGLEPTLLICSVGTEVALIGPGWFRVVCLQVGLKVSFVFESLGTEVTGEQ